jgi:hypothetical protein
MAPKPKVKPKPYDPFAPMFPTLPAARQTAQQRANQDISAQLGALTPEQTIRNQGAQRGGDIDALSRALATQLEGNRQGLVGFGNNVQGLIGSAYGQAAQGANAAAIAAGGQAQMAPQGVGVVGALTANTANALQGGVQAAQMRGNLDQQANLRALDAALAERAQQATAIKSQRGALTQQYLDSILESDLGRATAGENNRLAWTTLGYNQQNAQAGMALDQARLEQQAASDAAGLAQDQQEFQYRQALDAAKLQQAQQRIDLALKKFKLDQTPSAGGGKDARKRRDTIVREANRMVQQLQKQQNTATTPASTRPTGQTEFTYGVSWLEPSDDPLAPPKPRSTNVKITAASAEEAQQKLQAQYANFGQSLQLTQTGATPQTEKIPGSKTSERKFTDDQIRGQVFNLFRSYGMTAAQATTYANRLVPKKAGGSGGSVPTQTDRE